MSKGSFALIFMLAFSLNLSAQTNLDLDFDIDRGYFTNPFNLSLSVNDPAASIRYTTNGDRPTPSSGTVYTNPIPISTTSYIRAIAYSSFDTTKVLTHTYVFPSDVINQSNTQAGFPSSNFSFDASITNHSTYGPLLEEALSTIPSISLVMNLDDFNDVHELTTPVEYETSVEVLLPYGEKGYQANGGLERAGGSSFNSSKRNFRLSFKSIFGDSKFDFPLFGEDAAESFDQIALKPGFHGCMHLGLDHGRGGTNDLADQVMRNLQGEMSEDKVHLHGDFMHLYINGIYWGVYNPSERGINSFGESYYGGDKDNYDALKGVRNPGSTFTPTPNMTPRDGNSIAWDMLINLTANLDLSVNSNYQQVLDYIEPEQFADYVILTNFGPHADDNQNGKNSFVTRDRTGSDGFRFWIWDTEPAFGHYWTWNVTDFGSTPFNPIFLPMLENSDFKTLVGDRVQCHCFEDGALTVQNAQETYDAVYDSTDLAFIAEAARWAAVDEYDAFVKKRDTIVNDYLPGRTSYLIDLYRENGAYPTIDGVGYNKFGGIISQSFPITLTNTNGSGTIYYTTDNTDPKTSSGGVSGTAQIYNGSFTLSPGVYTLKARVRSGSTWSAMCPTTFYVDQNYGDLVINEIHYNPNNFVNPPDTTSGRNFEFLEIKNCGDEDVNMRDMFFEKGIRLTIKEDLIIPPNGFAVFAEDEFWFQQRYGFLPDARYAGKLDNGGENLWLANPENAIVDSLDYNDNPPWPGTADKGFYSLALLDCNLDNADPANWSIQSVFTTPRAENFFTNFGEHPFSGVVINEIHYNPMDSIVPGTIDTINGRNFEFVEIKNISTIPIDLSGAIFARGIDYEFANGTIIQPGDFIVLAEDRSSFLDRYGFPAFGKYDGQLDNGGETLWLVNAEGVLLDAVTYDDIFPWDFNADGGLVDYSLALVDGTVDNDTYLNWRVQCNVPFTPGAENDLGCFTGPDYTGLTINELDYRPNGVNDLEFVELFNNSFLPIDLEALRISDAISYDFPSGQLLPGQYYIIARDSALFENTYNVAVDGSFTGGLSSIGETILLTDLFGNTIDIVSYDITPPWTDEPAQGIKSLALIDPDLDNNNGGNWCVQQSNRTPKAANDFADTDNDGIVDCIDSCPALDNDLIGTACDDGDPCTPSSFYTTNCNCEAVENAALAGTASMSSQFSSLVASNLNNDIFTGNSELAHTGGSSPNEWFEIDLGSNMQISSVVLWNRINCCSNRINNVYIMVADTPFPANTDITQSLNNSDYTHQLGDETGSDIITVNPNASGRYVRIQKSGNNDGGNFMNLRELQVFTPVTIVDTDNDGDCDVIDQCPNFDNTLIGQSCDDNDPCTTGDVYTSNCACEGTVVGDADNDGICNDVDQCPNFDDDLIGTTCDDNDPCTTNDLYTNTCDCMGTAVADSDGDGVCNAIDICPNFDDNLIGTTCDDNDPCTTNDLYTNTCDCVGTAAGDSDGDGVCNAIDQCPNFDDNLIGQPCDDGIICFVGSTWDANCNCSGGAFSDLDNDNVCDPLDQCPGSDDNVDVNTNGIPDGCEGCADYITESTNSIISSDRSANINITTNGRVFIGDIEYHAGQDIDLTPGFEVKSGAVFHAYIAPCN